MKQTIDMLLKKTKRSSVHIATLSAEKKEQLLLRLAEYLTEQKGTILAANSRDIVQVKKQHATTAFIDRLTLTEKGFMNMITQLQTIAALPDVTREIMEERTLANGIVLQKTRFPLGVVAMIYESRPNVTVDVSGLCIKSGNAVVLKGGSEAVQTNRALLQCIHAVLDDFSLPKSIVTFLDTVSHEAVDYLLSKKEFIDVVIPRGSYVLTTAVSEKSRIPILYHASGGACLYVDASANLTTALNICVNAKTNRTGVCNALDVILVHNSVAKQFLPNLDEALTQKRSILRAEKRAKLFMKHATLANKEDFFTEFLDNILAIKIVSCFEEALSFIGTRTHGHTEVLIAEDAAVIQAFIRTVDAAGLMINCSSRLHDGGEFGMGAEMGIATGKLHARGPVGVRELTTYKWIAYGNGQIKE